MATLVETFDKVTGARISGPTRFLGEIESIVGDDEKTFGCAAEWWRPTGQHR